MDTHEQFDMREGASQPADGDLDRVLRPATFDDFTGQRAALDNLQIFVAASKPIFSKFGKVNTAHRTKFAT